MTSAPGQPGPHLIAAFYDDSVAAFLRASDDEVYAPLASLHGYTFAPEQLSAWRLQLPVLRAALADFAARAEAEATDPAAPAFWIHLEFDIPWLGRWVDAVLVMSTAVIPIEFEVGAKKFQQADYKQAWDYGLDIENFHASSHAAAIFPILCATEAPKSDRRWKPPHADGARPPFCSSVAGLGALRALHLSTTMRSFRVEHLSRVVKALLDGEAALGRELFAEFRDHYPIVCTRSMRASRRRIRRQRRGTERVGLVASSSAPTAQAPRDRHPGEHRPSALVFEPTGRHPLIAISGGRSERVSGGGAGARLDDRHVGRRPSLDGGRLELSQFSRGEVDRREEARTATVSAESLSRVANAGPAGGGDRCAAWGESRSDAESGFLRRDLGFAASNRSLDFVAICTVSRHGIDDSPSRRTSQTVYCCIFSTPFEKRTICPANRMTERT
jgi:hypothetical protein